MSKGADSAIYEKCLPRGSTKRNNPHILSPEEMKVMNEIEIYASGGFRTLTFAYKILDPTTDISVLEQEEIEDNLTLLGATCVEDLLQTDVSQCLSEFKQANIQCWMLTGDKGTTAKMIGVQCGLLSPLKSQIGENLPDQNNDGNNINYIQEDSQEKQVQEVKLIEVKESGIDGEIEITAE